MVIPADPRKNHLRAALPDAELGRDAARQVLYVSGSTLSDGYFPIGRSATALTCVRRAG